MKTNFELNQAVAKLGKFFEQEGFDPEEMIWVCRAAADTMQDIVWRRRYDRK